MTRLALVIVFASLLAAGCRASGSSAQEAMPDPDDVVSAVGMVQYVDLEGGFYGIVVTEGLVEAEEERYLPLDLDAEYRQDGLRVRFRGTLVDSMMSVQMWGRPIEVLDITRLE